MTKDEALSLNDRPRDVFSSRDFDAQGKPRRYRLNGRVRTWKRDRLGVAYASVACATHAFFAKKAPPARVGGWWRYRVVVCALIGLLWPVFVALVLLQVLLHLFEEFHRDDA